MSDENSGQLNETMPENYRVADHFVIFCTPQNDRLIYTVWEPIYEYANGHEEIRLPPKGLKITESYLGKVTSRENDPKPEETWDLCERVACGVFPEARHAEYEDGQLVLKLDSLRQLNTTQPEVVLKGDEVTAVWAALVALCDNSHSPQADLSQDEWEAAQSVYKRLTRLLGG